MNAWHAPNINEIQTPHNIARDSESSTGHMTEDFEISKKT